MKISDGYYISSTVPSALHILTHLDLVQPFEMGVIILPFLEMKKLKHRETGDRASYMTSTMRKVQLKCYGHSKEGEHTPGWGLSETPQSRPRRIGRVCEGEAGGERLSDWEWYHVKPKCVGASNLHHHDYMRKEEHRPLPWKSHPSRLNSNPSSSMKLALPPTDWASSLPLLLTRVSGSHTTSLSVTFLSWRLSCD